MTAWVGLVSTRPRGVRDLLDGEANVKILVVDDHPLIREALQQLLHALDSAIELIEAQSSSEALEQARLNPDTSLILLDLALPGVDGFETLRQLRDGFPTIPVVVLSASEEPDIVVQAIDAGAMGFIPKASSSPLLVQALRLVLSGGTYLPAEILRRGVAGTAAAPRGVRRPFALRHPHEIGLTERQSQVLKLLLQGKPNKLICKELKLAENTVKIHVTAILRALGVTNRTQAVVAAGRLGLKLPK